MLGAENAAADVLPEPGAEPSTSATAAADATAQESQMRVCKARLVELLQPGENALDALRRLAVHTEPEGSSVTKVQGDPMLFVIQPCSALAAMQLLTRTCMFPSVREHAVTVCIATW